MKAIYSILVFALGLCAAVAALSAGAVFFAGSGTASGASGHFLLGTVYLLMCLGIAVSVLGMLSGAVLAVLGFIIGCRIRTIMSVLLSILCGVIWQYLLNCGL